MDWNFILLPVFLGLSAVFSMSETALFSLTPVKIQYITKNHPIRGKIISRLLLHPQRLLVTNSACNTTVNIIATLVATNIFNHYLPKTGYFTVVIVMTLIILIIGEVTPKTIAIKIAPQVSLIVSPILFLLSYVLTPFTFVFRMIARFFAKLTIVTAYHDTDDSNVYKNDEMIEVINQGQAHGVINKEEGIILKNVITFGDDDVYQMMRPRKDMFALSIDMPMSEVMHIVKEKKYSRIPVYGKNEDDIKGILYARDLNKVRYTDNQKLSSFRSILHKPFYVSETMSATTAFTMMRQKTHIAIVIDEYGEVSGLLTLEDIFENIVGDVVDKDDVIPAYHKYSSEVGEFDGDITIDDFNAAFETNIAAKESVTLAGYVLEKLHRIPVAGEIFSIDKLLFKIIFARPNKIEKMQVSKIHDMKKKQHPLGMKS